MKVNGSILTENGFMEGHVVVENGVVTEISERMVPYPDATGIVIPYFFNHHTHLGDSFIEHIPKLPLDRLVGPGGFKERALRSADDEIMIAGMKKSLNLMKRTFTSGFIDFREGGVKGLELIEKALQGHEIDASILSRPVEWKEDEMEELLQRSDGFGISALSDHDFDDILMASEMAHRKGKLFAIHFSERIREDVGQLLELRPDMIVHAIEMEEEDFQAIADAKIPVVICPRSNAFFGKRPRVRELVEHSIDVRVGTDNGMIAKPDMIAEIRYLYLSTPKNERKYVERILTGIFERKGLKERSVGIETGRPALLVKAPWLHPEKGILGNSEIIPLTGSGPDGRDKEDTDSD